MTLTMGHLRKQLQLLLARIVLYPKEYGTYSLRRGAATFLMLCGVPVHTIKAIGDWHSDCVTKHFKPNLSSKLSALHNVFEDILLCV